MGNKIRVVKKLLFIFIFSRIILFIFPWLTRLLYLDNYSYQSFYNYLISSWSFWDAPHFLYIAQNWYTSIGDPANFIVFFPMYPLLTSILLPIIKVPEIAGIFISTICIGLSIPIFYKLVKLVSDQKISYRSLWYLLIFPTSFFLTAPYSESLYLLLWSISFLSAFKGNWKIAGISAGLASFTRNFGLLILPALLIQWFQSKNRKYSDLISIIFPTVFTTGAYLLINRLVYNDQFAFVKIMSDHWQKSFSNPITTFVGIWKLALLNPIDNYSFSVGWVEGLSILFILVITLLGYKKIPFSLFVYQLLSLILVSSTSFVLSTPRYILSIPTIFIILGVIIKNPTLRKMYEFTSIGLLFCLTYFYTLGKWVF